MGWRDWRELGFLALLPLYDARGELRSVRARRIVKADPKEGTPQGFEVAGLVLACVAARRLLAGDAPARCRVLVVEGAPDFLTWTSRQSDASEDGPAIFGTFAGGWSREIAAKIPDGARVALRTHQDAAGRAYSAKIAATLAHRCEVLA
jgi:hypothetical protein